MSVGDRVTVELRLKDAAKFYAEAKLAAEGIEDIGDKADLSGKKSRRFGKDMNLASKSMKLLKFSGIVAGLGLLTHVLIAASVGAFAFVSALAPVVGLIGALPAGALIAAQGMTVMKMAFTGVGKAVGGLNAQLDPKKLAALTPEAQRFAIALQAAKRPVLELQKAVQKNIFPGFTQGIRSATPALTAMRGPLAGTGRMLGSLAARLGKLVGSSGFLADLRSQAQFNNVQIGRLGGAGLHLVNVFRNLAVASRPLVAWLVRMVAAWAATTDNAVTYGRVSGRLARGFHTVRVATSRLFRILGDLGHAFYNVGKAGKKSLGDSMLVSLVKGSDALRKWTESADGIKKMNGYFAKAKPIVSAVGRLFKAIGHEFAKFGSGGKGVAGLVDQLTGLVPILGRVVRKITAAFGPALISALAAALAAFSPLVGAGSPLVLILEALTGVARGVAWLARTVPGAAQAMSLLATAFAVLKTVGLLSAASKLFGFQKGLAVVKTAMIAVKDSTLLLRAQLVLLRVQEIAAAAASKVMAASTAALNLVMDANPIALVVIALVAIAAAFYVAYKKVGWFRHGVNSVFGFIKSHWPLLLAILTGPIGLAVLFIVHHWDKIKSGARSVYSAVAGAFGKVVSVIKSAPGRIAGAAKGMFNGIKNAFRSAINFIIRGWNSLQFKMPSVNTHIPGVGKIGGFTVGVPHIPELATGGRILRGGLALVGERGPELRVLRGGDTIYDAPKTAAALRMAGPAMVSPSVRMRAPKVAVPGVRSTTSDSSERPVIVHSKLTATLTLPDGTVIADLVDHAVGQSEARS